MIAFSEKQIKPPPPPGQSETNKGQEQKHNNSYLGPRPIVVENTAHCISHLPMMHTYISYRLLLTCNQNRIRITDCDIHVKSINILLHSPLIWRAVGVAVVGLSSSSLLLLGSVAEFKFSIFANFAKFPLCPNSSTSPLPPWLTWSVCSPLYPLSSDPPSEDLSFL